MRNYKKELSDIFCNSVITYVESLCQLDFIISLGNGCAGKE